MIQLVVVAFAAATMAAALGTAFLTIPGEFNFTWTTGFFPPHRGYSAYVVTALLFLAPQRWLRWAGGATLLLGATRAAWVGVIAGWAWGHPRRLALAAALGLLAVVGGNAVKPRGAQGDSARVLIWKAAIDHAAKHPSGSKPFIAAVGGYAVTKAHSDALQILVDHGYAVFAYVLAALILVLAHVPASPWKSLVVCLTVQSILDNRLHHPACAALYALAWFGAWRERQTIESNA